MLNVCITFDYELFLGKNNAPYKEILFAPTDNLIRTLSEKGVSGTFFADVCSVDAHHRLGNEKYCEDFTLQLQSMVLNNQDVQLHLHPSWLYAEKKDGQIVLSNKGYRLHEFGFGNGGKASQIIRDGISYLENTCRTYNSDYKCVAYRAGGFSVQPERALFSTLIKNGIRIDSSVVPHMYTNEANAYDFTKVPAELNWWIDPDKGISCNSNQTSLTIFEVPVATVRPRIMQVIGKRRSELGLPPNKVLGEYVKSDCPPKKQNAVMKQYHRLRDYRYVSLDTRYYLRVMEDLEYIYRKYGMDEQDGYVCLICHPKLADERRVMNIAHLIDEIRKVPERFALVNFSDIYKNEVKTKESKNG